MLENIFEGPYEMTDFAWVFAKEKTHVFDTLQNPLKEPIVGAAIYKLNGGSISFSGTWKNVGTILVYENIPVLRVRGWGKLIGTGTTGLGLSAEEAVKVQDEFIKNCLNTLNDHA